jgi:hypothetical protein
MKSGSDGSALDKIPNICIFTAFPAARGRFRKRFRSVAGERRPRATVEPDRRAREDPANTVSGRRKPAAERNARKEPAGPLREECADRE